MTHIFDPDVPLQHQIYQHLKAEILAGVWEKRTDFPGEEEAARRYGVSVITSRRALIRLVDDGLLTRNRGRRPQPTALVQKTGGPPGPPLFPMGPQKPYTYKVLDIEVRGGNLETSGAFGIEVGEPLWHCSRLRSFDGRPHSMVLNVQRKEIGILHRVEDLESRAMNIVLREMGFSFSTLRRQINTSLPTQLASEHLRIAINSPILLYTYTLMSGDKEEALEWVQIALHPDETPPVETFDLRTGVVKMSDVI